MKRQIKEIASLLLIFFVLIEQTSCFSTKILKVPDLPSSTKLFYEIHGSNTKCQLENTVISDGILSGRMIVSGRHHHGGRIKIYLPSDSLMKIDSSLILTVDLKDISKIEQQTKSTLKMVLLIAVPSTIIGFIAVVNVLSSLKSFSERGSIKLK
jgi:hypothetical protein